MEGLPAAGRLMLLLQPVSGLSTLLAKTLSSRSVPLLVRRDDAAILNAWLCVTQDLCVGHRERAPRPRSPSLATLSCCRDFYILLAGTQGHGNLWCLDIKMLHRWELSTMSTSGASTTGARGTQAYAPRRSSAAPRSRTARPGACRA